MRKIDADLDRLLKSAAKAPEELLPTEAPFGFATRVMALSRQGKTKDSCELTRLLRRVVICALALTLVTSAAAYRQINEDEEIREPLTNDYAIADNAIQKEFIQ